MTTTAPDWSAPRCLGRSTRPICSSTGAWSAGIDSRQEVVSPIDGRVVTEVAMADAADVDRAVASAARASFEDRRWAGMAPADRKDVMIRWAHLVNDHADQLAVLTALEMGKPAREAKAIDVRACHRTLRWFGEAIDKVLDEMPKVGDSSWAMIEREPAGVVGAVTPWNFPLTLETWKIAPALAVGLLDGPQARGELTRSRRCTSRSWRWRRACPMASSTSSTAWARSPARRWPVTWTSTSSPSPARPRRAARS